MAKPQLFFRHKHGRLYLGDAVDFLKSLKDESADLIFADPPYNLQKEIWDRFGTEDEYLFWTVWWIKEASRVLKPTGSMYLCGFSEILADIKKPALSYFNSCKWLVWFYKNKANLRNDWGRSHESMLHLRKSREFIFNLDDLRIPYGRHTLKYPERTQSASSSFNHYGKGVDHTAWQPHPMGARPRDVIELPTVNNGGSESTLHPAQKPEALIRKIVLASTNNGDLVVDPFSGSGTTLVACEQLGRRWLGCDNNQQYNTSAVQRIESVKKRAIGKWIAIDKQSYLRRA